MSTDDDTEEPPSGSVELARAAFTAIGRIEAAQAAQGGKLELMQATMEDVKASSATTATQSTRTADIAERREKLEIQDRKDARETSGKRMQFITDNWKLLAVLVVAAFVPAVRPVVLGMLGVPAAPAVAVSAPAPAPVAAPALAPVESAPSTQPDVD